MAYPHEVPNLCQVCGGKLKRHERAEQFCDRCLRAAQAAPFLKADREAREAERVR